MFHLFLLIPNRIREIKEDGRKEGRAEALAEIEARAKAQPERREEGLREGGEGLLKTAIKAGREMGIEEERERLANLIARYDRGEIDFDELRATLANRPDGDNGSG